MSRELATVLAPPAPANGEGNAPALSAQTMEQVVIGGDLSRLAPVERVAYYRRVCESLGLNPFTKPFEYIVLNGKLTLYARKDATDQLRRIHRISIADLKTQFEGDLYIVTAHAIDADGRTDQATGAVSLKGLSGDALANAIMKCETKAKRRVTLSICGLGWTDESEVETIPGARVVEVSDVGEIIESPSRESAGNRVDLDAPRPESVTETRWKRMQWDALQRAEGWFLSAKPVKPKDESQIADWQAQLEQWRSDVADMIGHLLGNGPISLDQTTGDDLREARLELESRNQERRRHFAALRDAQLEFDAESHRRKLGAILGRDIQSRRSLSAREWRICTAIIESTGLLEPPEEPA